MEIITMLKELSQTQKNKHCIFHSYMEAMRVDVTAAHSKVLVTQDQRGDSETHVQREIYAYYITVQWERDFLGQF